MGRLKIHGAKIVQFDEIRPKYSVLCENGKILRIAPEDVIAHAAADQVQLPAELAERIEKAVESFEHLPSDQQSVSTKNSSASRFQE